MPVRFSKQGALDSVLVSSSIQSGMPSVCSMIRSIDLGGQRLAASHAPARAFVARCPSRLNVGEVTAAWPVQGGSNSGRNVTTTRTGEPADALS